VVKGEPWQAGEAITGKGVIQYSRTVRKGGRNCDTARQVATARRTAGEGYAGRRGRPVVNQTVCTTSRQQEGGGRETAAAMQVAECPSPMVCVANRLAGGVVQAEAGHSENQRQEPGRQARRYGESLVRP